MGKSRQNMTAAEALFIGVIEPDQRKKVTRSRGIRFRTSVVPPCGARLSKLGLQKSLRGASSAAEAAICGWGSYFEKSEFPSSHHREEGWRRHQENGAKPPYGRRRGGVPCPIDRNTTPSSRKADAAQYFLERSATPPRGDARRGIIHFENSP